MNAFHKVMQNCWDYHISTTALKSHQLIDNTRQPCQGRRQKALEQWRALALFNDFGN